MRGVLFALQEAAKRIQDDGRIVNVSSTTVYPSPGLAVYAASKATEKIFTEVLAKEIGQVFVAQLATLKPEQIVDVDESGMDSRDDYAYGCNEQGQRFYAFKSGRRQGRVNMIAALCQQQIMAPFTVLGACNRTVFEIWLSHCLLPQLKPGQVVVMDNATFHKRGQIEQLIQDADCQVLYLPPYSPDLNKIERCWSWLKSRIRKQLEQFDCLRDTMEHVLRLVS